MGMRPRLLPGLDARWVPQTAEELAAALPAVTASDALYLCQDASGGAVDALGSNDLDQVTGAPTFGVASAWGRKAILINGTQAIRHAETTFADVGDLANDVSWAAVATFPKGVTLARGIGGSLSASAGYRISMEATAPPGRPRATLVGAGGQATAQVADGLDHSGRPSIYIQVIDADGNQTIRTLRGEVSAAIGAAGDCSNTVAFGLGATSGRNAQSTLYHLAMIWDGYALTATERRILRDFFS
jgi:hypothetical protein